MSGFTEGMRACYSPNLPSALLQKVNAALKTHHYRLSQEDAAAARLVPPDPLSNLLLPAGAAFGISSLLKLRATE